MLGPNSKNLATDLHKKQTKLLISVKIDSTETSKDIKLKTLTLKTHDT